MKSNLEKELKDLHHELSTIKDLDNESILQLKTLRDDIDKIIQPSIISTEEEHGELMTSLHQFVEKFEETHPKLIVAANRAIRVLGQMGISG